VKEAAEAGYEEETDAEGRRHVEEETDAEGRRHVEDVSAVALAEKILALLEQDTALGQGKMHFKAGNLQEANELFRQAAGDKGASPGNVVNAKTLLLGTLFRIGVHRLHDRAFEDAAAYFDEAQGLGAGTEKNIQKCRLMQACSLYEAGKRHREEGDWGVAKRCFGAARKTKALPDAYLKECYAYLDECDDKCDDIADIRLDDLDDESTTTFKIEGNGVEGVAKKALEGNQAFELFKQAKRAMARGDDYLLGPDGTYAERLNDYLHDLSMPDETLGIDTSIMSTPHGARREMLMVLDGLFPPNSKERGSLMTQLQEGRDIRKALSHITDVLGPDFELG
jgi:hypothetical protein